MSRTPMIEIGFIRYPLVLPRQEIDGFAGSAAAPKLPLDHRHMPVCHGQG
jgi:hypothetical protein